MADPPPVARPAAVSLLLRPGELYLPELLFIKRADFAGDPWSGHIALPGGRMETHDATLWETAVRETLEEVSIDLRAVGDLLGTLTEVAPRTSLLPPIVIHPFVALVPRGVEPVPSSEVAEAFWVPLQQLFDPARRVTHTVQGRGEYFAAAGYEVHNHFVWGLTERILSEFLKRSAGVFGAK